jgi:peptide chain release factor 1
MKIDVKSLENRKKVIETLSLDPSFLADSRRSKPLLRELRQIDQLLTTYAALKNAKTELRDCEELLLDDESDEDFLKLAKEEEELCRQKVKALTLALEDLLLPTDPHEGKSIFLEIRAGAGGDEASLFVSDLATAYTGFCEIKKIKWELVDTSAGTVGGYKEWIGLIKGESAYRFFQFESGVHRVQRVPETESSGRVHTSTITVAVLPEAEDYEVDIKESDLRVDTYRASGAGGQHVNKTDSAVRITHLPTGIVVSCQDGRSQIKNREQAMKVLKAKLLQKHEDESQKQEREARKSQVGRGDRSERIRTYNYNQRRITDHRIQKSYFNFQDLMRGEIEEIIRDLLHHKKLSDLNEQLTQTS